MSEPFWWRKWLSARYVADGRGAADGGFDCYGLVRAVAAERFNYTLPDWTTLVAKQALVQLGYVTKSHGWTEVEKHAAQPGDLVFFRTGSTWNHVGIVVEPGLVLHLPEGRTAETVTLRPSKVVLVFRPPSATETAPE